jgi:predicted NAD/FAD-binding protein
MDIAIIGSGISGLAAASRLHKDHKIAVFEADDRIGGHAHTVDVNLPDKTVPVDTGFIVYNNDNYPGFSSLLAEHSVVSEETEMSFGVDETDGIQYRGSNLSSMFAERRNFASAKHWRMLFDIARFNRAVAKLVASEAPWAGADRLPGPQAEPTQSIGDFLSQGRYSQQFVERFLIPFGSAIWSASPDKFTSFPVRSYARFMANHGLLGVKGRKQWRTITGGSREYVQAVAAPFRDRIQTQAPVLGIASEQDGAIVETAQGKQRFDAVVIATHSDTALKMISDPTQSEREVLGDIHYTPNVATLHSDKRMMPPNQRAWASWNYHVDPEAESANVTYWMNRLQNLDTNTQLFVSLNRQDEIDPSLIHGQWTYDHPEFDLWALAAQRRRQELQGVNRRWYAGAYWGYGFHEDGTQSGFEAARQLIQPPIRERIVLAA